MVRDGHGVLYDMGKMVNGHAVLVSAYDTEIVVCDDHKASGHLIFGKYDRWHKRYSYRFRLNGEWWYGTRYGDNTTAVRCRKAKRAPRYSL